MTPEEIIRQLFPVIEISKPEKLMLKLLTQVMEPFKTIFEQAKKSCHWENQIQEDIYQGMAYNYVILFIRDNILIWNKWARETDKPVRKVLSKDEFGKLAHDYEQQYLRYAQNTAIAMLDIYKGIREGIKAGTVSKQDILNHTSKPINLKSPVGYSHTAKLVKKLPQQYQEKMHEALIIERQYLERLNLQEHRYVLDGELGKFFEADILEIAQSWANYYHTPRLLDVDDKTRIYSGPVYDLFYDSMKKFDRKEKGTFRHYLKKTAGKRKRSYPDEDRLKIKHRPSIRIQQFEEPEAKSPTAEDDDLALDLLTEDDILGDYVKAKPGSEASLGDYVAKEKMDELLKVIIAESKLSKDEHRVLFYRLEGYKFQDIAPRMNKSVDAVKQIGSRAIKKCAKYVKEINPQLGEVGGILLGILR